MKRDRFLCLVLVLLYVFSLSAVPILGQERSQTAGAKSGSEKDTGATAFFLNTLTKGEVMELNLNKRALPVTKISFVPQKTITGDLRVHIRRTYDFPTRDHPRLQDANSYFEVNTVNFKPEYFSKLEFELTVEKVWLDVRKLPFENVRLYRLVGGGWQELPTQFVEQRGTSLIFKAQSPGFSYFGIAVSGLGEEELPPSVVNETEVPEPVVNESEEVPANESEEYVEEDVEIVSEGIIRGDVRSTLVYWAVIAVIMFIFYILSRVVREDKGVRHEKTDR